MEKREPATLYTVDGNVNWYSHCGKQYGGSSKIELQYDSIIPLLVYIAKENENTNLKSYGHPSVHRSIIYNYQGMEAT